MLKFIKTYWLYLLLIIIGIIYTIIKSINSEVPDAIFALAFSIVAVSSLINRIEYDFKCEDYNELVIDYIKELDSNLNFIQSTKQRVADMSIDISEVKKQVNKKPTKKKKA